MEKAGLSLMSHAGRRQRHPRVVVISANEVSAHASTSTDRQRSGGAAAQEALASYLAVAKHMLQCVFPLPEDSSTATPASQFASFVPSQAAPFAGYSPEKTLRSVRALVECFSPADLDAPDSGRRALSDALTRHLHAYADGITAALEAELLATPTLAVNEEEAEADADVAASASPAVAAEDQGTRSESTEMAFYRLVAMWSHFRSAADQVANLWVYLGMQSTVTCTVRYLEAALEAHPTVLDRALTGFEAVLSRMLRVAESDKASHATERAALHDFTALFLAINQYMTRVQPAAVMAVRRFYQSEAARRLGEGSPVAEYYQWIDQSWAVERARCQDYLHPETAPLLEAAIDECALNTDIAKAVVQRDLGALIESRAYDAQQLLLRVASRSSVVEAASVGVLTRAFRSYIETTGKSYMHALGGVVDAVPTSTSATAAQEAQAALDAPFGVVCAVMALLQRCEDAVQYGFFKSQKEFSTPLHEGLQTVLCAYTQPFSDQLAQYLDFVMKEIEDGVYPLTASTHDKKSSGAEGNNSSHAATSSPSAETTTTTGSTPPSASLAARRSRSRTPPPPLSDTHADGDGRGQRKRAALEVGARPVALMHRPQCGEAVLTSISRLFSYHPSKDYFEAFYWRGLSCRLLHPYRTPNLEAEEFFIRLLKAICGGSVTSKFEGMLLDMRAFPQTDAVYAEWVMSGGTSITKPKPMNANRNAAEPTGEAGTASAPALTGPLVPPPPPLRVHCRFFTQGFWPSSPFTVRLPPVLARQAAQLEGFYQASFNNRRLQWRHGLATAELLARYVNTSPSQGAGDVRSYQLFGTFAQSIILMYLDEHQPRRAASTEASSSTVAGSARHDGITVKDLCEALDMDRTHFETRDALHGLCHPRCRLVVRASADGEMESAATAATTPIGPTDVLRLNDDFTASTLKVRLPCFARPRTGQRRAGGMGGAGGGGGAGLDHADEEANKVASKVVAERDFMIEVAISRFMKAHRTCSHEELMEEAPKMLRFAVTSASMKKCIEKLITRNFLARNDAGGYEFVV